jgi:hypothetical protein
MSNREKCISIINFFTEEQLMAVAEMLESAKKLAVEMADDVFCAKIYENYLENPDKGEAVDFEDFAREIGVNIL